MPEIKRPLKVFLSYASQDKPIIRNLSLRLIDEGWIDVWLDEKKLLPGHDWRLKIEEAVETSDIVIICLSSNSVTKEGFVQKELRYAREIALEKPEETIFLIPLRLDECDVPRGLRFYQWVDYYGEKRDESYSALIESLKLRHDQKLKLEEEESARREKEKLERDIVEKAAREKIEQEASERALRKRAEWETAEKFAREKAEREAVERATQEKIKQEAAQKTLRERRDRLIARKAAIEKLFSKAIPSPRIVAVAGVVLGLFWIGSWAMPKFFFSVPIATPTQQIELPVSTVSPTTDVIISQTPLPTQTPDISSTPSLVDDHVFKVEHLETITAENLSRLIQLAMFTYDGNFLELSPSGKTMITDAGLVYDLETQQVVCDVSAELDKQGWNEFALSDSYAVVHIYSEHQIKVWSLQECTEKEINIPSILTINDIAIAPNDINVLFQGLNSQYRHVLINWNLVNEEQEKRITLGSGMSDIRFSSNGVTFVASTGGGFAQIYTFSDFSINSKFAASNVQAHIISYWPEKDVLITSDGYPTSDTNIRVWRISEERIVYKIADETELSDGRLGLSPDGSLFVTK